MWKFYHHGEESQFTRHCEYPCVVRFLFPVWTPPYFCISIPLSTERRSGILSTRLCCTHMLLLWRHSNGDYAHARFAIKLVWQNHSQGSRGHSALFACMRLHCVWSLASSHNQKTATLTGVCSRCSR